MKRLMFLVFLFLTSTVFAAPPAVQTNNVIQFTAAGQASIGSFDVGTIAWVPVAGSAIITPSSTFVLFNDGTTDVLLSGKGTWNSSLVVSMPISVNTGTIWAQSLDAGQIFIYGKRK